MSNTAPYEPVQYSGPIYLNTIHNITEYQPPTSELDQRPDIQVIPMKKYPKQPVPKIPDPIMDRVPQDRLHSDDGLKTSERERIFLDNSKQGSKPLYMHEHDNTLANPLSNGISSLFFGTVGVVGLFIVYRAMQMYS